MNTEGGQSPLLFYLFQDSIWTQCHDYLTKQSPLSSPTIELSSPFLNQIDPLPSAISTVPLSQDCSGGSTFHSQL